MDLSFWITWCSLALALFLFIGRYSKKRACLPPGPYSWPFIGSLLSVGRSRHRSFARLAKVYGPIMYLDMGVRPHVIISSPALAKELFKEHDAEFASRPQYSTLFRHLSHNFNDLVFSPYGDRWKFLRRICAMELFTSARVSFFSAGRLKELQEFAESLRPAAANKEAINMSMKFHELFTNLMSGILFGHKFYGSGIQLTPEAERYQQQWNIMIAETERLYIGDFIPPLKWLDRLKNSEHRLRDEVLPAIRGFLHAVVDEHKRDFKPESPRDFVDVMLSLNGEDKLGNQAVIAIVQNMFLAGTVTTRATMEWAFSELVNNPQVMQKAQQEIDKIVGRDRALEESDLKDLTYIHALVKEVLRLHPVAPMGLPHYNKEESTIGGYRIPANTTLLVNIWAIGRDPASWSEPERFYPDRFLGSDHNVLGQHFELIPFSSGRRRCVGIPLAIPHITLTLAYLLQQFNWSTPGGGSVDMGETTGQVCLRACNLVLIASPR